MAIPMEMRQNLTTFVVAGRKIGAEAEAEGVVVGDEAKVEVIGKEASEQMIGVAVTKKQTWDVGSISMSDQCYSIDTAN